MTAAAEAAEWAEAYKEGKKMTTSCCPAFVNMIKQHFPQVKIYLWTGYYYEDLLKSSEPHLARILDMVDILIDGPYIESKRDITLPMRGSSNQSIINLKEKRNESNGK